MPKTKDENKNNNSEDNQCNHLEIDEDSISRLNYQITVYIKSKLIVL